MLLLVLSIAFLFLAPILNTLSSKRDVVYSSLNGFVFVIIIALISIDILPGLIDITGPSIILMLLFGLALPTITEKAFHNTSTIHKIATFLGVIGIAVHTTADGTALALEGSNHHLALSVAIHRIPIGLFVWWFIRPHFGSRVAFSMLAIIALGTIVGYTNASSLVDPIHSDAVAYFQAFVVGTLIHILFHKPPLAKIQKNSEKANRKAEGIGNLLGLLGVAYLLMHSGEHGHGHDLTWLEQIGDTLVYLSLETAPMLLLAFLFAGIIKTFMPESFVGWLKQGRSLPQATKGMAVGIPLPLCSCSVVPVYHSLIKKGVPPSAAMAFLIATPELGIDAILISLPLLGADLTIARLVCAAILAVVVALVVSRFGRFERMLEQEEDNQEKVKTTPFEKVKEGLHYATHDLLDHIAPWIVVGVIVAAVIHPVLGNLQLADIPSEVQVVLFAALGIPVYVCASSATPLVAIFLIGGVSPGAGLAFLLSGPATNISTFGVLAQLHNKFTAGLLALTCLTTAIALGLATNMLFPDFKAIDFATESHEFGLLHQGSLVLLLMLFAYSIFRNGMRAFLLELIPHKHDEDGCSHGHSHCSHGHHGHSHHH